MTYAYGERAVFAIGERVETELYGRGTVETYYRDYSLGWSYCVELDDPPDEWEPEPFYLVESALTAVSAVEQLGALVAAEEE